MTISHPTLQAPASCQRFTAQHAAPGAEPAAVALGVAHVVEQGIESRLALLCIVVQEAGALLCRIVKHLRQNAVLLNPLAADHATPTAAVAVEPACVLGMLNTVHAAPAEPW